ncbi:IQ domain-containing protein K [Helicoverpa armigera]|uniref:IQ domain-containing protein K n=1 Tax=Helicoverpa armigera TaxID=29058 RepID=UPI000B36A358|nr:IQ domain-containing protein K [Helicoverpa armigera]XP_047027130.1 IQ domain-containing protein K-like [Helicoverpa zea]PZC84261.1 hypothetical protein B5X24_HaOG205456 [Helicoverpa armigera]
MAGKSTDRKGRVKETKSAAIEQNETAGFTLPDSLPCSEIDFPVLIKRRPRANWKEIIDESNKWHKELDEYNESKQEPIPRPPFLKTETDYIKNEVFVQLIPALVETLNKAKIWQALTKEKCFFNGIDHIVQVLWNNNPRYPGRKESNLHLFNMPWVRATLKKKPRPLYPKSWLWPEEYAATLIQKTVRQYFVQKQEEVQEMREFWKKLEVERNVPDMEMNPFLAKAFASSSHIKK